MDRAIGEFIRGFLWGLVAFVHFAVITVVTYKFALNCLPLPYAKMFACFPSDSASCPSACDPSKDSFFYVLVAITAFAAVLLPFGIGFFRAFSSRANRAK